MPEASVSVAGNLTDDPQVHCTQGGTAQANFRVARSTGSSPTGNLTTSPSIAQRLQGLQFVQWSNRLQSLNFPCGGQPDG
jgi:hypothetical protein